MNPLDTNYLSRMVDGYSECAAWTDEEQIADGVGWSQDALASMETDCASFIASNALKLARADRILSTVRVHTSDGNGGIILAERPGSGYSPEQAGHDLWLTRNGHGCGFWDRGLGATGEALTEACRPMGGSDAYTGDDGWDYVS